MSFKYKHRQVTLDNYHEIFSVCTPDILDEIRSAILDDTPIAEYINACKDDNYKLGQIRMALRELIPIEYINASLTGKTIHNIRIGYSRGMDMGSLLKYISDKNCAATKETIEKLSEFVAIGTQIDMVDFNHVNNDLVDIVLSGLYKGYPMWLITNSDANFSVETVRLLMRAMNLEIDISPFLSGKWDNASLLVLFSYAEAMDINTILPYINEKFTPDMLNELIYIARHGCDIKRLCTVDEEGYPIFNNFQVYEIGQALLAGIDDDSLYNENLSPREIQTLRENLIKK